MNIEYKKRFCDTFAKRFKINIENKMISDYWFEIIEEKDKEIERLNKENEELKKIQCTFLGTGCKVEIERLNNIIDKLEKELEERYLNCKDSECEELRVTAYEDISILIKLKKLKGENKDE